MSFSDKRVQFGLGQEKAIAEIEIRWPSGAGLKIGALSANQVLELEEP